MTLQEEPMSQALEKVIITPTKSGRPVNHDREIPSNPQPDHELVPAIQIHGSIHLPIPNSRFEVEVVGGKAYLNSLNDLMAIATEIDAQVFYRKPKDARLMMERNMKPGRDKRSEYIPSMLLFRERNAQGADHYIGFSTQRVLAIPTHTQREDIPVLYWTTRAFETGYRDMDFGKQAASLGRVVHKEASWGAHRTQVEIAVRSMQNAGVFEAGRFYPWDRLYSSPDETDELALEILNGLFVRVRINGRTVNQDNGVSISDYPGPNRANDHIDLSRPAIAKIHQRMKEFGMNKLRGDAAYGIGRLG